MADSTASQPRRIAVVGAVIVRDGLILAARRGPDMSQPGLWEFPGGKVEIGESQQAALRREIAEELGCTIRVGKHLATAQHPNRGRLVILDTYWCTIDSGEPRAVEHAELRWVTCAELDALDWSPADLPTVAALRGRAAQRD